MFITSLLGVITALMSRVTPIHRMWSTFKREWDILFGLVVVCCVCASERTGLLQVTPPYAAICTVIRNLQSTNHFSQLPEVMEWESTSSVAYL